MLDRIIFDGQTGAGLGPGKGAAAGLGDGDDPLRNRLLKLAATKPNPHWVRLLVTSDSPAGNYEAERSLDGALLR